MKARGTAAVFLIGVTVLSTAACSAPVGGRTAGSASVAVAEVPGVNAGTVRVTALRSGFTTTWQAKVEFTPEADFAGQQAETALRSLIELGWSVNEHELNGGVAVIADGDLDLVTIARSADLGEIATIGTDRSRVVVPVSTAERLYGPWPAGSDQ